MSDDLLQRAARALREESDVGDAGARFTRARVMAGLQHNAGRRRLRLAFALPLAACFAAATAFGMKGGQPAALWHQVSEALGFTPAPPTPKAKPKATPPRSLKPLEAPPAVEAPAPVEAPSAPTAAVEPERVAPAVEPPHASPGTARAPRNERPTPSARSEAPAPAAEAPINPPPEVNDPAHELYRVAHQAHFVEHDFASALRAWDAYLAAAPSGRFAPEARYNRALCLVRLGRKGDAERALRPFAEGAYGTYRRDEAKALIEALER